MEIKINGIEYNLWNKFDGMPLGVYCGYLKVMMEREFKEIVLVSGEKLKEEIPKNEESIEFQLLKNRKLIGILSDIPEDLLDEIHYSLIEYIEIVEPNNLKKTPPKSNYEIKGIESWTFQQFCDFENLVYEDFLNFFALMFNEKKYLYDRMHPDFQKKRQYFANQLASDYMGVLYDYFNDITTIKGMYQFVFGDYGDDGTPAGKEISEHLKRFKWEDTIVSLANNPAPIFNHSKGTLYGVRNANCFDVIDYLNVKTSRDIAEKADSKSGKMKEQQVSL